MGIQTVKLTAPIEEQKETLGSDLFSVVDAGNQDSLLSAKTVQPSQVAADSSGSSAIKGVNIEDIVGGMADSMQQAIDNPAAAGFEQKQTDGGKTEYVYKPDPVLAKITGEMYVEFLGGIISGIGLAVTRNDEGKYLPNSKYMQMYKGLTEKAIESGEVKLPSPMTMFIIATIGLLAISSLNIFKDFKKEQKKEIEKKKRLQAAIDESRPKEVQTLQVLESVRADITQESERGRFNVDESGFYTYAAKGGQYWKKNERHIKPSLFTEQLIKAGKSNEEIKEAIINHLKSR